MIMSLTLPLQAIWTRKWYSMLWLRSHSHAQTSGVGTRPDQWANWWIMSITLNNTGIKISVFCYNKLKKPNIYITIKEGKEPGVLFSCKLVLCISYLPELSAAMQIFHNLTLIGYNRQMAWPKPNVLINPPPPIHCSVPVMILKR